VLESSNSPREPRRRASKKSPAQPAPRPDLQGSPAAFPAEKKAEGKKTRRSSAAKNAPEKPALEKPTALEKPRRDRRTAPQAPTRTAPQAPTLPPMMPQSAPSQLSPGMPLGRTGRPRRKRFFLVELLARVGKRSPAQRSRIPERGASVAPTLAEATNPSRRNRQPAQPPRMQRPVSPLVHATRLLIVGVGVGAIAGTTLSVWSPATRSPSAAVAQAAPPQVMAANALSGGQNVGHIAKNTLGSGQEMTGLIAKIAPLVQGVTDLTPGVFMVDLDKGNYYSLNGDQVFSAASTIKVPVLIAFFQDVDAGKIRLDEVMTMETADMADNSGDMQFSEPGTKYSALEVATNMIVISDNTATNMMIRRLGGMEQLNQRFKQWGLQQTAIRNRLPDLTGTNTVTPKELTTLLTAVSQGQLISMASRDRALAIMRQTETATLLPSALGEGATISHKTGDIKSMVGDTGVIDMPSGKRYVITTLMKRPDNDSRAQDLIRQIAGTIYQYLDPANVPAEEPAGLDVPEAAPESSAAGEAIAPPSPAPDAAAEPSATP
jgi:beta-lactamase class A